MVVLHEIIGKQDLELRVERQESLEKVLFRPEAMFLQDPVLRVFPREEDIVDMDDDARIQPGDDLQKKSVDVTPSPHHM